jgi:hypothetical protein
MFMNRLRLFTAALLLAALTPFAQADAISNAWENTLIDVLIRGQNATINSKTLSWSSAPSYYVALATSAGSDTGCGTEVSGGSYARVAVVSSLANWAGTQGAGTTVASSGTGGTTSNNNAITFPAPTGNWGSVVEFCVFDASSAGNLAWRAALTQSKTINNGDAAPSFAAAALTFQIDN